MARITVEDCIERIPDRFKLIVLAAQRVKGLSAGEPLTVYRDNDKNTVVALREIAAGTVDPYELEDKVISSIQKQSKTNTFDMGGEEVVDVDLKIENFEDSVLFMNASSSSESESEKEDRGIGLFDNEEI